MTVDFLTLLKPTDGSRAGKRVTPEGVSTPVPAKYYRGVEAPLQGPEALFALLDKADKDGHVIAVRGKIRPDANRAQMRRTHVNGPTLDPAQHHWLLIDLDKHRLDVDMSTHPASHWAGLARQDLPEDFRGASCWYQATSSARVKPGLRMRLAFWLEKPIDDAEAKAWLETWPVKVDLALYTPSQPHFLASPRYEAGALDPFQDELRSGVLPGDHSVRVRDRVAQSKAQEDLLRATRTVSRAPDGERRNTLNREAYRLSARWAEDELPLSQITESLEQALPPENRDFKASQTLAEALRDGRSKHSLDREGWRKHLARDESGQPRSTAANVSLYLEHHPVFSGALAYDERSGQTIWLRPPPWPTRGTDVTHAVEWFQSQARIDAKPGWVKDGLHKAALVQRFDPIQDYLENLPEWDGQDRLDTFLVRHLGVEDTRLHRAQTRCWFIQAHRRAYATISDPVQADLLLVVLGKQGIGKSTLFRALCPLPRFFRDSLPSLHDKDCAAAVVDSWIIELSELTQRKADQDLFKAFISRQVEKFRRPYMPNEEIIPRRCVLVATSNDPTPLTDPTGSRRFCVMVAHGRATIGSVISERDQLWAEARVRAHAGENAYLSRELEQEQEIQGEEFAPEDLVHDKIERLLNEPSSGYDGVSWQAGQLTAGKLPKFIRSVQLSEALRLGHDSRSLGRISSAMRKLGWHQIRRGSIRVWYPNDSREEQEHAQAN